MKSAVLAAVVIALSSGAAGAATPDEISGSFEVEVEISPRANADYLAQFRIRDAVSRQVLGEPSIAFTPASATGFSVGASAGKACDAANVPGYCIDLSAGPDSTYEAFITKHGRMQVRKRAPVRVAG